MEVTFHHIGRPVPLERLRHQKDVKYSPLFDMYSLNMMHDLPIPMEYHAFGPQSTLHERIQTEPHIAFKVDDIVSALEQKEILMPLYQPFEGYQCAMVLIHDSLIELIQTSRTEDELWNGDALKGSVLYPTDR